MKRRKKFKHLLIEESLHRRIKELAYELDMTMGELIEDSIDFSLRNDKTIPLSVFIKMCYLAEGLDVQAPKVE